MIVAVVGPECTGKTTLARRLSEGSGARWLPEFARGYLEGRGGYSEDDLEQIARRQLAGELSLLEIGGPLVVLDTDLIVIHVWWQEKYGRVPEWVREQIRLQPQRLYLLTRPDIPWQPDPLRESPADRDRLLEVYRATLAGYQLSFSEIYGQGEARTRLAETCVQSELDACS